MTFGAQYAGIYDALYRDKDYPAEALFALNQLRSVCGNRRLHILDLGCGTGLHAVELARHGCSVTGVDRSAEMIRLAEQRRQSLPQTLAAQLRFDVADMRSAELHETYDAVLSLFHVICYMTVDHDLDAALRTMRRHLNPGGAVVFDFWHEAAFRANPPESRVKVVATPERYIHRRATPRSEAAQSLVRVTYDMEIRDEVTGDLQMGREEHLVRYFSPAELEGHLTSAGLAVVRFGEWLTDAAPSETSFGVYVLAKGQ